MTILDRIVDTIIGAIFFVDHLAARIARGWFAASDLIIRGPR